MDDRSSKPVTPLHWNRMMVIGQDVATVQRVSRYCLDQGAEVFPYYGLPNLEEITLFNPDISVFCSPVPESFLELFSHAYIFWSEQQKLGQEPDVTVVTSPEELVTSLKTLFARSNLHALP